MNTAKIFLNGKSQAVRLPKECRFKDKEIYVKKMGDVVVLLPKDNPWESFFSSLDHFSADFMKRRSQPKAQTREKI
ncbi:MAG: antitoxin [Deltaproteobacteria bacterium]|nr:antitoxin [Deltaproteobacteria bacterium]